MKHDRWWQVWLVYFCVGAYAWSALAGVGFLLMLAFLADSSPAWDEYLTGVLQVAWWLFGMPLLAVAAIAAVLSAVHVVIARLVRRPPGAAAQATDKGQITPPARVRVPWLLLMACGLIAMLGMAIILHNAPRSLNEHGFVPTVMTSLIFFVPLVLLPLVAALRLFKRYRARRASPP